MYIGGGTYQNQGVGGWAAVLVSPKHGAVRELFGAVGDTTSNRIELTAGIEAFSALKRSCYVDVYSRSQYFCLNFERYRGTWWDGFQIVPNDDLWEKLFYAAANHEVEVHFTSRHEYADRLHELIVNHLTNKFGGLQKL